MFVGARHHDHRPINQISEEIRGEFTASIKDIDSLSEKLCCVAEDAITQRDELLENKDQRIEAIRQSASNQVHLSVYVHY